MKIRNIDLGRYPIFLAPMEDVTDPAFRLMCKKFGADMVYTEFVSADALIRSVGKTMQKLNINDEERPRSHPDLRQRHGNNGRSGENSGRGAS